MTLDALVTWIVIGAIAGILADVFIKGTRLGLLGDIVVGMLGGVIGGWLFAQLNVSIRGGLLADVIVSFIGAVILLLILRAARRR
jgi:uncharacterized membrane protein YeaQ/YmgE (transglycosylase-associated protein family)